MLFYNEELHYYISEEQEERVNISDTFVIKFMSDDMTDDTKYNRINRMLMALESESCDGLLDMMEDYVGKEYIIRECFLPLS